MKTIKLAIAIVLLGLFSTATFAQGTPDGQTPAEEDVCDGLSGAAFGLCNAYCEATDCGDGVNYASFKACASLQKNWKKKTGLSEMPCDCADGETFIPGEGCLCGDLLVRIIGFRSLGCPTGQGSCDHAADIEVFNLGSLDIVDPFNVLVELPGVGLANTEDFPLGLNAGTSEQRFDIFLGTGDNCYDPNCEVRATVDESNDIPECDETNNRDLQIFEG
jgi:hypothetical protein